jgi:long-subunit acyl-CoA synthetase (AMP-forming)
MNPNVITTVAGTPPAAGHRITVVRLDGTRTMSLVELHAAAGRLARGLRALGVGPGDRVGILAANSLEWVLLDLAALRLGAVTAGFEPGKFSPDAGLLERYRLAVLFTDRGAVLTGGCSPTPQTGSGCAPAVAPGSGIRGMAEVAALVAGADPAAELPAVDWAPRDVTTIKFTSGSTGEPKGLGATAGSVDSSIRAVQAMFEHGGADDLFLFLPLSLLQQRYWIYSALCFGHDVTLTTYEAAFATMRGASPTVVMGVPGFYEAARKHITRTARDGSAGALGEEALGEAARRLFGTRIRYLWTGSAPANPATLEFFTRLGMPIYEGYGLNETCIVAKNHPRAHRAGSVGQVLPGKRVLFDAAGVISIASDHPVSLGYEYAPPGESARVFAPDGTVRTGDLGYLDEDGYLFIRGRADDVIVLDNGKKIIVRPLEEFLKAAPQIDECVVLCPTQTHLTVVVSPTDEPADVGAITARVALANSTFGRDERIAGVVIAPERFTVANGMLTSQFKPRRSRIQAAYLAAPVHGEAPANGS